MVNADIALVSIVFILAFIYLGLYIPVTLGLVSFVGVWIMRGDIELPIALLALATADTISHYVFAVVPLFAMMGLLVSKAGLGQDIYQVANLAFRRVLGGLGIATVAANAVFASITGSSIASASVFTRISVPAMRALGYHRRFAVGVVAGSSVLGMLIPPSVMLILYSIVAEQSVGQMFLAGIAPGLLLAAAFSVAIVAMARFSPGLVMSDGRTRAVKPEESHEKLTPARLASMTLPTVALIVVVLGGLYGGVLTPTEAGAAGALGALIIAIGRRSITLRGLWEVLVETGHITASILFLIIAASMYSRMLGVAGLPTQLGEWIATLEIGVWGILALYVALLLVMGTILDTASIILILVPLFLPVVELYGLDLVWFGIVTVVGAEIGLLTPPLGISCFVIKSTLPDRDVSLLDVFAGAFPFALVMLLVLVALIAYPGISLVLL